MSAGFDFGVWDRETEITAEDVLISIEVALRDGHTPSMVLDENSPLRDAIRTVLARSGLLAAIYQAQEQTHDHPHQRP